MTFWDGLIIGVMIGVIIGVIVMAMMFVAKGTDEIISELYQALEEWVEYMDGHGVLEYMVERYFRSCKALNRATGME